MGGRDLHEPFADGVGFTFPFGWLLEDPWSVNFKAIQDSVRFGNDKQNFSHPRGIYHMQPVIFIQGPASIIVSILWSAQGSQSLEIFP